MSQKFSAPTTKAASTAQRTCGLIWQIRAFRPFNLRFHILGRETGVRVVRTRRATTGNRRNGLGRRGAR
jgi:hypothetical protein